MDSAGQTGAGAEQPLLPVGRQRGDMAAAGGPEEPFAFANRLALLQLGRDSAGPDDTPCTSSAWVGTLEEKTLAMASAGDDKQREGETAALLLQEGNAAFHAAKYEEAVEIYSRALIAQSPHTFVLLSNRCAAFCSLSKRLREIPAEQSERRALYGLDPMALAQLALRDAEKLVKLTKEWPKAHFRRGCALQLLEQYDSAREAFLDGLQLDWTNKLLQEALSALDAEFDQDGRKLLAGAGSSSKRRRGSLQQADEFDCSLCLKLLYSPVTTPCGHSFCRSCLVQALDHGNKCPVCRTVLLLNAKSYPVSVTLQTILQRHFPEEYSERKQEMDAVALVGREVLPMFVMDVVLPGQKMALNIFEPRYRLMVRRCMEGDHKMGMVGIDRSTRMPADVACEVVIRECEPLPDGRFYLEVEGQRRCRIVRSWEQDGYRVGQVECLADTLLEPGSDRAAQAEALAKTAAELAQTWMTRLQEAARSSRQGRLAEVIRQSGDMPPPSQVERLSFWLANLLLVGAEEKLNLMRMTDTIERLTREIEYLRADHSQYCRLQ